METADRTDSSKRLNSSKQPHAPHFSKPTKIRPMDFTSMPYRKKQTAFHIIGFHLLQRSTVITFKYVNSCCRLCAFKNVDHNQRIYSVDNTSPNRVDEKSLKRFGLTSSQLKTRTCRPNSAPSALTDSVLPVPAGPYGFPPRPIFMAWVSVR